MARTDRLSGGGPIFKQLARRLAGPIEAGDPPVGGLLPTEDEIAKRHGVSRHTVRHALAELRSLGLIESRQGVGSIVVRSNARTIFAETFSSVEELIRAGRGTPLRTHEISEITADEALAARLRGGAGQSYLRVTGVRPGGRRDDAKAAGFVEVYVDSMYAGVRALLPKLKTSIAEAIDSLYGVSIARIDQEITVDVLSEVMAARLHATPGAPALWIQRWYHASNGRVFEVASTHYPMGGFVYRSVLTRGAGS
jgi:GntR family transcriptional regulator